MDGRKDYLYWAFFTRSLTLNQLLTIFWAKIKNECQELHPIDKNVVYGKFTAPKHERDSFWNSAWISDYDCVWMGNYKFLLISQFYKLLKINLHLWMGVVLLLPNIDFADWNEIKHNSNLCDLKRNKVAVSTACTRSFKCNIVAKKCTLHQWHVIKNTTCKIVGVYILVRNVWSGRAADKYPDIQIL